MKNDNKATENAMKAEMQFDRREAKVLQLVEEGFTTAEIADALFLSESAVETYRGNMLKKVYDDVLKLNRSFNNK